MRHRRTNFIDVDLNSYVIVIHKTRDALMAIESTETQRLHKLCGENEGFENVPFSETVNGIYLDYCLTKNVYNIQTKQTHVVKINELEYVWIAMAYSR